MYGRAERIHSDAGGPALLVVEALPPPGRLCRSPDLNRLEGNTTRKRVPLLGLELTSSRPPCVSTISLQVKMPSPMPFVFVVAKGRKRRVFMNPSLMPTPVSATLKKP